MPPSERSDLEARTQLHARTIRDVKYHPPDDRARAAHELLRAEIERLAHLAIEVCPPGRELSLGLTDLVDGALMHFNAAVARNHDRLRDPSAWALPDG
jgi:hypothetical protein